MSNEKRGNYNKRKYQKKKPNNNQASKEYCDARDPQSRTIDTKVNDPSWYAQNEYVMKAAASIPYVYPLGTRIDRRNNNVPDLNTPGTTNPSYNEGIEAATPGICVFPLVNVPGLSNSNTSAVNTAARNFYSYVRHVNAGHSNYDAPDLMLYILAVNNVYAMFTHFVRLYGLLSTYSPINRYYAKYLVEALGGDYDNLVANAADFNYLLNAYAVKIGSLCVPSVMPISLRNAWVYSGLYADGDSPKAQTYAFAPAGYYVYDEISTGGGKLQYHNLLRSYLKMPIGTSTQLKISDIKGILDDMIDPIMGSEDMQIMSGDILKAYGVDRIMKVSPTPDTYSVVPQYSEEVLSQIENMAIYYGPWSTANKGTVADLDITQDPSINAGTITFDPEFAMLDDYVPSKSGLTQVTANIGAFSYSTWNAIINFHHGDITPGETMVATRLHPIMKKFNYSSSAGKYTAKLDSCGTELCLGRVISVLDYTDPFTTGEIPYINTVNVSGPVTKLDIMYTDASTNYPLATNPILANTALCSKFDWMPELYLQQGSAVITVASGDTTAAGVTNMTTTTQFDIEYFSNVNPDTMKRLHETATLSEYDVPLAGAVKNNTK